MSPRRSSRARTTQPPPGVTAAHSTSSASTTSSRGGDRATRINHKQSSPQKSLTPHSLSSDELDEPPRDLQAEPPLTRRRTREHDNDGDEFAKLDDELDDEIAEEDEVTRCLCGQQEYPGQPSDAGKFRDGQLSSVIDSDLQGDDAGGLFIQCDICKVWQHGGCVGIMEEAASPDEYFCEECRKDLHKVMTSPKGQKYSRYLPVWDQQHGKNARKGSLSKESDKTPKDKDRLSRASVESFSKRRSTMNSRAAYDEDEVLRKVLEESKHEGAVPLSENGNRKKRSRDDSEEAKSEVKRQRTSSRSPSGSPVFESDDEGSKNAAPKQKPRGAAARSQREKEQRDKERERERAEAANRRKGRAERRKGDESEPPEALPAEESSMPTPAEEPAPAESPAVEPKPAPAPRKGGRPPQKRRLGRNQYTRDAPMAATNGASPAVDDIPNSPQVNGTGNGHDSSDGVASGKVGKPKNWRLQKLSWHDIRRPAGAMQNYISQRQVEMAGEKPAPPVQEPTTTNGIQDQDDTNENGVQEDLDKFTKLSTLQMMDYISRDLTHWQQMISEPNGK
ncbi:Histone deacetylase complex subunit [Didymosphaeria variabile]|uniref:Histone deacetylase complex subunit n=1 Tax=Didymosphaeria variabile TaxID=1932322 RepID=A0A9W9CCB6_9PLEO|nr:Histone deacetylase complex subunit [Didymosphaeria variabile]KAJ4355495.1 Histone deacetylase complex subunit [Didymosphaeria variabile]